ncbi:hypothetical protein F4V43_02165 [Paenibacillus spiritus]|uniref:Accessory regulator AgrB n=1 Tax=Paenibacillus spiritus TaxID=2496557 RepID=A0A5J5GHX7_9BACL|nr:hypothetical protein F4V43_02165 [Paenibacillus spiritus]
MIEHLSFEVASFLKKHYERELPSFAKVKFTIKVLITNTLPILFLLILSNYFGQRRDYLLAIISFALLRKFSGGYHSKNADTCVLITTSTLFIASNFSYVISGFSTIITLFSIVLCVCFAPSRILKKTRVKEKYHYIFKILSVIIVILSLIIDNSTITLAIFIQSLLLINVNPKKEVKILE